MTAQNSLNKAKHSSLPTPTASPDPTHTTSPTTYSTTSKLRGISCLCLYRLLNLSTWFMCTHVREHPSIPVLLCRLPGPWHTPPPYRAPSSLIIRP